MGRVIAMVSGKGGVGKTTVTANLGIALAKRNLKVCLVDADIAMANLSLLLSMHSSPITLHDVLLGEASIQDAIYDGPEGVKLVPSGLSLESYRRVDPERLKSVIDAIVNQFDFILLDSPPGIEKNVMGVMNAAEEVLLITIPTSASIADVLKAKITAQRLNTRVIGILINMLRNEKGEIKPDDVMKMLELPIFGLIPYDAEIRRSFMQDKVLPVMVRVPGSPAAVAFQKAAAKIAGIKVQLTTERKKQGLISKLLSIFKRKPKIDKNKELEGAVR
jgi:septum site-determining protein MinD